MITYSRRLLYPEGDFQEINHRLKVNQLVDLNGIPLKIPLPTAKMIVYRVFRISTELTRNEEFTNYHLEQLNRNELEEYTIII
ncbi:MAG: hypothetical protein JW881_12705 [Spirochaetales bacterium]|nr:hypothetical protein [Spirochaetales bacterium]